MKHNSLESLRESLANFSSSLPNITQPQVNIPHETFMPLTDVLAKEQLASAFYDRLKKYIIDFESTLSPDEEIGLRLVSFGESITIHVDDIGFYNPSLICFYGTNEHGKPVQLIQHVTQLSFLLTVVPRVDPERERIGFILKKREPNEEAG